MTHRFTIKTALAIAALVAVLAVSILFRAPFASANPLYEAGKAATATATSTQTYLTPGTATTTVVYDSYEQYGTNQPSTGNFTLPDSVSVVLDGKASSTASTVSVVCEFSDNYNATTGNGDWYQNEIFPATTSIAQYIGSANSFSFTYVASSTMPVGGSAVTSSYNRFQKLFTCPVAMRFVRAVITNTGAPVSVWSAVVPKKQRN